MRTGLELELLAPDGTTRFDVARALADRVRGTASFGFKHVVDGVLPDGRPRCSLSLAARVLDAQGRPWATLVDDVTVRDHVDARGGDAQTRVERLVVDDTRISKWLEARSFVAAAPDVLLAAAPLVDVFACAWETREGARRALDAWGQVLAVVVDEPAAHHRVCEVVTRPLEDGERADVVAAVLDVARDSGCEVPPAAALHVHVDAEPWRDTARLCALVRGWSERRAEMNERLRPNPRCKKLGPFPADVARVARECPRDLPFAQLAAALKLAGAKKELDVNLLGVIEPRPVQPTLEVRCLPMSLDAHEVLASVDEAFAVLDELSADARART